MTSLRPTTAAVVGATHWLDHDQTVATWAKRAPAIAYPAIVAVDAGLELSKTPAEERPKTALKELIQLGVPTVATLWATNRFMKPELNPIPLTKSASKFIQETYPDLLAWADKTAAKQLKGLSEGTRRLFWGSEKANETLAKALKTPLTERLKTSPKHVLDIETKTLITGLRERFNKQVTGLRPAQLQQRWEKLTHAAEHFVVEAAGKAEKAPPKEVLSKGYQGVKAWAEKEEAELPLLHWPQYLKEQGQHLLQKAEGIKPGWLLKQELRLLVPIEDDFSTPKHLFNSNIGAAIKHAVGDTLADIKEEALPFFTTGGVAIASGVGSGLLTNHLFHEPKSKDVDVVKEGVFQFVANVCMCALGAASGMGAANLLGFSKFKAPVPRFLTISSGLAGGIMLGAKSAKTLSENLVEPVATKILGDEADSDKGRSINAADMALHLDDVPMALALSGLNLLKAFIPMFFFISGVKAADGYRNEELPSVTESSVELPPAAPPVETAIRTSSQASGYLPQPYFLPAQQQAGLLPQAVNSPFLQTHPLPAAVPLNARMAGSSLPYQVAQRVPYQPVYQ